MSLLEEITPWIDKETGMIMAADGGRDNLILCTATLIALLPTGQEQSQWRFKAWMFLSTDVGVRLGLYKRYPGATGNNSVDNLVAAAFTSSGQAFYILLRGRKNHWCFDVENPDQFSWRYWYGRFIGFPPFIAMASEESIGIFYQLLWSIACIYSALTPRENTSDKCLQYLMNRVVHGRHRLCDWAVSIWRKLMARKYPGGMRDVYAIYFGSNHPFTTYGPRDFK